MNLGICSSEILTIVSLNFRIIFLEYFSINSIKSFVAKVISSKSRARKSNCARTIIGFDIYIVEQDN